MGSTFLSLTNAVLTRLNEVNLTSADFAAPLGIHAAVKAAVNDAINDINEEEFFWPFNYMEGIQITTPETVSYAFPANTKVIDFQSFFVEADTALTDPVDQGYRLPLVIYEQWLNTLRGMDEQNSVLDTTGRKPNYIFEYPDLNFGISPIPDQAYTIKFNYWGLPLALVADTDTTTIPSNHDRIIVDRAMYYTYLFKENTENADRIDSRYKQGLKNMRTILINRYDHVYDTRGTGERTINTARPGTAGRR